MPRSVSLALLVALSLSTLVCGSAAKAALPSDQLLPQTTKGFISVADVEELTDKWNETDLGHLMSDPLMKPFADDLQRQIDSKLNEVGVRLSITFEDLADIYGGEVSFSMIQPRGDVKQHAVALIVDVTGHVAEAEALLERVAADQIEKGGRKSLVSMDDIEVITVLLPKTEKRLQQRTVCYAIHQDQLIAIDHRETCREILGGYFGNQEATLAQLPAYVASMKRCSEAFGDITPQMRWFIEPFGMVEIMRAANGGRTTRGTDLLRVLSNQGFRAIQGIGSQWALATGEHELLHHTYIHAPGPFKLGARMLDFPNSEALAPPTWMPRNCALFAAFKWNMRDAFEHSQTLIDEYTNEEIFEEVLKGIELDPNGPQISIRKELVAHLSDRAIVATDYRLPITPESERFMFAIELTNAAVVNETVHRAMEHDPAAKKREFNGHVIWEILNEDEEDELAIPQIDGVPNFGQFGADDNEEEEGEATLPNSAVTVAHDHLIIASHVDYVRDILDGNVAEDCLPEALDYWKINDVLQKLGAGSDSFRFFTRTDEMYRPTYELIRQGKMPESETMLGKLLNRLFAEPQEDEEEAQEEVLREQQVDGSKMPDYQMVRRYLGPAGMYVRSEDGGWFITGCTISKEAR